MHHVCRTGESTAAVRGGTLAGPINESSRRSASPSAIYRYTLPTRLNAGSPASISPAGLVLQEMCLTLPAMTLSACLTLPAMTLSTQARQLDCCAQCAAPDPAVNPYDRQVLIALALLQCVCDHTRAQRAPCILNYTHALLCIHALLYLQHDCCARTAAACPPLTSKQAAAHSPAQPHHCEHTAAACPCCGR